jgi:hypothetical protein
METEEIKAVLFAVTETILPRVNLTYLHWKNSGFAESVTDPETVTAWHVNLGWCDEWADEAVERLGGGEVIWLHEIYEKLGLDNIDDAPSHAVLLWNGKYYDSMNISGVTDPNELDFVKKKTLSQWIEKHECCDSCKCHALAA